MRYALPLLIGLPGEGGGGGEGIEQVNIFFSRIKFSKAIQLQIACTTLSCIREAFRVSEKSFIYMYLIVICTKFSNFATFVFSVPQFSSNKSLLQGARQL